jgi:glyoxylase-like metal-dependent hydrolase (beta-lactamase superfamily II)
MKHLFLLPALLSGLALPAFAQDLEIQPVAENIYALVGTLQQRSPENFGNNATFGVIVTPEGVVLVDAGASWKGAGVIDATIDRITNQPVKYVINTGGQDHRWLGNGYWQAHGAVVISSASAEADRYARLDFELAMMENFAGKAALEGTVPARADITFDAGYTLEFGGQTLKIVHPETGGHTAGDSFVWLAGKSIMFTGDIVFTERMPGFSEDRFLGWIAGFEVMANYAPVHVVPGHGHATTLAVATHDTYDYLVNLRDKMRTYIANGGDIYGLDSIDQSGFEYLVHYEGFAGKNAQKAFQVLEWE